MRLPQLRIAAVLFAVLSLATAAQAGTDPFRYRSTQPHRLKIVEAGSAAMAIRLQMIERARQSIEFETIIFYTDDAGRQIAQALISKLKSERKRNPGFRVRMLIDDTPTGRQLDDYYVAELARQGAEVRLYNSNLLYATHRNHKKLLLIDGKEALTGGRNVGNHYYDLDPHYNFVDRDVWVSGPGVRAMRAVFDSFWESKRVSTPPIPQEPSLGAYVNPSAKPPVDHAAYEVALTRHRAKLRAAIEFLAPNAHDRALRERFLAIGTPLLEREPTYDADDVTFLADRADWNERDAAVTGTTFYQQLGDARRSILLENPYFIPQSGEIRVIADRVRAGVDIDVLMNSREATPEMLACVLSMKRAKEVVALGATVHLYDGRPLPGATLAIPSYAKEGHWNTHAKVYVIDKQDAWIGTMNTDPRSIKRLNSEMAILVRKNPTFARALEAKIEARIDQSYTMDKNGIDPLGRAVDRAQSTRDVIEGVLVQPAHVFFEDQF